MDEFLEELTVLCNKHGVAIGGCGCCGSPWVEKLPEGVQLSEFSANPNGDYLTPKVDGKEYEFTGQG